MLLARSSAGANEVWDFTHDLSANSKLNNTRAFFTKDAGIQDLGGGLELWRGYFQ